MHATTMRAFMAAFYYASASIAMTIKNRELVTAIKTAPVNLDKFELLKQANETWTYDFTHNDNYTFKPGSVNQANIWTAPMMVGTGMTMQVISLGPCGILPPHEHPRGDNIAIATHGTTQTWMYNENGADFVSTILTPGVMTVFPHGSVHSMMNMGCSNAQLISVLNHEDPGTLNILNGAVMFPQHILKAAFQGELSEAEMSKLKERIQPVGTNAQWGVAECYKACGIQNRDVKDVATFDDGAPIWDGKTGTKEGYYDVKTGKMKAGVRSQQ